ncbi:MAG: hypothetical protein H6918_09435 [Sphingomonadaceae bacterium]|nr:hypothetical protein [Sphingomonadaceae bacterium]
MRNRCCLWRSFTGHQPVESARNGVVDGGLSPVANDGRHRSLTPIKPVLVALGFVECLHPVLLSSGIVLRSPELQDLTYHLVVMFRVLVAIGALVLLHNLYAGASATTRAILRWTAAALAGMWVYDLNLYTIAYLGKELPLELAAFRGLVIGAVAALIAFGGNRSNSDLRFSPSRAVAFQTLSLLVIGLYLLVMVGLAQSLDFGWGSRPPDTGWLHLCSNGGCLAVAAFAQNAWLAACHSAQAPVSASV